MNATTQISEVSFPPYTLTGGVAYRELQEGETIAKTDFTIGSGGKWYLTCDGGCIVCEDEVGDYRRRVEGTPDNYRAMQSAWLSHFNVGVGSRVRVVRTMPTGTHHELGWPHFWNPQMSGVTEFEVKAIDHRGIDEGTYWFPFHVLAPVEDDRETVAKCEGCRKEIKEGEPKGTWADGVVTCEKCSPPIPVEEQAKVEVIELTKENSDGLLPDVTHLVEVPTPRKGEVYPPFMWRHFTKKWGVAGWNGKKSDGSFVLTEHRFARRAEPHEHPPAVPEGQGFRGPVCKHCGRAEITHVAASRYCHGGTGQTYEESPTPAIERGEEPATVLIGEYTFEQNDHEYPESVWAVFNGDLEPIDLPKITDIASSLWSVVEQAYHIPGTDTWTRDKFTVINAIAALLPGYPCIPGIAVVPPQPTPTPSAGQEVVHIGRKWDDYQASDPDKLREMFHWMFNKGIGCQEDHERLLRVADELTRLRGEVERLTGELKKWHEVGALIPRLEELAFEKVNQITTLTADLGRAREELNDLLTWNPMAHAPRDGRSVLIHLANDTYVACSWAHSLGWHITSSNVFIPDVECFAWKEIPVSDEVPGMQPSLRPAAKEGGEG